MKGDLLMKQLSKIMSIILVLALVLASCGSKNNEGTAGSAAGEGTVNSLTYIMDKKAFMLGLDASFPPMGQTDEDNQIVGFDIDVVKEVCKRMGIELKLQPIDWKTKEQE